MDAVERYRRVADEAHALMAGAAGAQWSAPTPCEGWDARTLANHMIGVVVGFVGGARKTSAEDTPAPLDLGAGDPATVHQRAGGALMQGASMGFADDELAEAWRCATAALAEAWSEPGALERTVYLPFSEMPGPVAAKIVTADGLLHSWDLAKALGQPFTLDAEISASTLETMQAFYNPEQRGPGKAFGHAIPWPETAPVQERLLALSGRQP